MWVLLGVSTVVYAEDIEEQHPEVGNFVLPVSQRPGPLVGFGQNVLDQNQLQFFVAPDDFIGIDKHTVDVVSGILYGISDDLSLFLNIPVAASFAQTQNHSAGFEDIALQLEYVFYNKIKTNYEDQATLVTNITFPTGSSTKKPPTGFGAPSFFVGTTLNRTYVHWFAFTSYGAVVPTTRDGTTFGNAYLYQLGLGRDIAAVKSKYIVAWLVELDGQYSQKNVINGATDPNSGGNIIYLTPSLWVSSQHLILQLGVGSAVAQHLFGNQTRSTYLVIANLGLTL